MTKLKIFSIVNKVNGHLDGKEKIVRNRILLLFLIIALFSSFPGSARAQSGGYDGMDILFLVDQSTSMGRNDPNDLRFYAPWYAMYWMGEDRLLVHNNFDFRLAIVNFGGYAEPWVFDETAKLPHWAVINPASRDTWDPMYNSLTHEISVELKDTYTQTIMGHTDFVQAFQAARNTFDELGDGSDNRLRVVIILTDGEPSGEGITTSSHMNSIIQYAQMYMREPDYRIFTVGMVADTPYWPRMEQYWEEVTNDPCPSGSACQDKQQDRAGQVATNDEVGIRFQQILQGLTAELATPGGVVVIDQEIEPGSVSVPPYLSQISFTVFGTGQRLILQEPNGQVDPTNRPDVSIEGEGRPIQSWRIKNPVPGQWFVATEPQNQDVKITMRQIFAQGVIESPGSAQIQFVPTPVRYALLDEFGGPLPSYNDPQFALVVSATVSTDGQTWSLPLADLGSNKFEAEFTPVVAGQHNVYVHAESRASDGSPVIVYDGSIGSFDVTPAVLKVVSGADTWQQYLEDKLVFNLVDSRGLPVISQAQIDLQVDISGEGSPVNLPAEQQIDGSYLVKFTPEQKGLHKVRVKATIVDSSGNLQTVADQDVFQFEVLPTIPVSLTLIEPSAAEQRVTGLLPSDHNPLQVVVELRDPQGNVLDPAQVFATAPGQSVGLTVLDQKGQDFSDLFSLSVIGRQYRAESIELNPQTYEIRVEAKGAPNPGYVLVKQDALLTASLRLIRHPAHLPILIGLILLGILVLVVVFLRIRSRIEIKKHPCKGSLAIVEAWGQKRFDVSLDSFGRNVVEFPTRDKPIPAITHVTKMKVTCASEKDASAGKVQVSVWLDNGPTPVISNKLMGPESEVRLGRYNFWLLKDPSIDQLVQDRSDEVVGNPSDDPITPVTQY